MTAAIKINPMTRLALTFTRSSCMGLSTKSYALFCRIINATARKNNDVFRIGHSLKNKGFFFDPIKKHRPKSAPTLKAIDLQCAVCLCDNSNHVAGTQPNLIYHFGAHTSPVSTGNGCFGRSVVATTTVSWCTGHSPIFPIQKIRYWRSLPGD